MHFKDEPCPELRRDAAWQHRHFYGDV